MDGACIVYGSDNKCKVLVEKLSEKDYLEP
jgi:hypothetical protein